MRERRREGGGGRGTARRSSRDRNEILAGSCCCCSVWGNDVRTQISDPSPLPLPLPPLLPFSRYHVLGGRGTSLLPRIYLSCLTRFARMVSRTRDDLDEIARKGSPRKGELSCLIISFPLFFKESSFQFVTSKMENDPIA